MKLLIITLLVFVTFSMSAAVQEGDVGVHGTVVSVTSVDATTDLICYIVEQSNETIECILMAHEE